MHEHSDGSATDEHAGPAPGHLPVMVREVLDLLGPALELPGAVAVDLTVGLGGHAEALLAAYPTASLLGVDRDPQALAAAGERLAPFGDRVRLARARFDHVAEVVATQVREPADAQPTGPVRAPAGPAGGPVDVGTEDLVAGSAGPMSGRVTAVLADLGVSSLQLDSPLRGFSYARDTPLDMRMDPTGGVTAADVLNTYPQADLVRVLRTYGEERFAARIAAAVVRERTVRPFTTSARLVEVVRRSVPAAARRTGGNPAKRTFQALRIEVNGELDAVEHVLPAALDLIPVGGRLAVLSYHSLEDRLVKRAFAAATTDRTPPGLPVGLPAHAPVARLLTRGAHRPSPAETEANPRAASARLRAVERTRPGSVPAAAGGPSGRSR